MADSVCVKKTVIQGSFQMEVLPGSRMARTQSSSRSSRGPNQVEFGHGNRGTHGKVSPLSVGSAAIFYDTGLSSVFPGPFPVAWMKRSEIRGSASTLGAVLS